MFCSKCKVCSKLEAIRRNICVNGHILCEKCDDKNSICSLCLGGIDKFIQVKIINDVPSLFMSEISKEQTNKEKSKIPIYKDKHQKTDSEVINEHLAEYHSFNNAEKTHLKSNSDSIFQGSRNSLLVDEIPPSSFSSQVLSEIPSLKEHNNIIYCNGKPMYSLKSRPSDDPETNNFQSLQYEQISVSNASEKIEFVRFRHDRQIGDFNYSQPTESVCSFKDDKADKLLGSLEAASDLTEYYKNLEISEPSASPNFNSSNSSDERKTPSPPAKFKPALYSFAARSRFSMKKSTEENSLEAQSEPLFYYDNISPVSLEDLSEIQRNLPRGPVVCPITFCEKMSVPSDYCNHISVDHPYVPLRRIYPEITANFEMNLKGNKKEFVKCQMMFLVSSKISDLGYGDYADCLPVAIMTSTVNLKNILDLKSNDPRTLQKKETYYIFWLLGIYEYPLTFTLTVWAHEQNPKAPKVIKTLTNTINFINHRKSFYELFTSGNVLVIPQQEMDQLTSNFEEPLNCQITIH